MERIYDDDFFCALDGVANALDSVDAREDIGIPSSKLFSS